MAGNEMAQLPGGETLVRIEDLVVEYRTSRGATVHAVSGVSLDISRGETLGLVGESGCGKSTIGLTVMMLRRPTSGQIHLAGRDLTRLSRRELRRARTRMHMIFQNPLSSLNPLRRVRDIVAEGLSIARSPKPWLARVDETLLAVGLDPSTVGGRRPTELSGGQCQRVAIARALILNPTLVVCDEAVSALDVSVQAQILNLLEDMKDQYALTVLFIAHDLAVVKHVSDRVAVMYLGRLCEVAPSVRLYTDAQHPYTQALLSAIPDPDRGVTGGPGLAPGNLPSPLQPPSGCRFRTRCLRAQPRCSQEVPALRLVGDRHYVACHFPAPSGAPSGPLARADTAADVEPVLVNRDPRQWRS